jgi:hypothetical protein
MMNVSGFIAQVGDFFMQGAATSRWFWLAILIVSASLGCKPVDPKHAAEHAEEVHNHEHGKDGHDHGHEHGHEGHSHEGHDHAKQSKTYAEAVARLQTLRDTTRDALSKGETEKADEAIHEVGDILDRQLHKIAHGESFSDADLEEIDKAGQELFAEFDKLDVQIHGDKKTTYDAFATAIDSALERLQARVPK